MCLIYIFYCVMYVFFQSGNIIVIWQVVQCFSENGMGIIIGGGGKCFVQLGKGIHLNNDVQDRGNFIHLYSETTVS